MGEPYRAVGGCQIGVLSMTWPFAKLWVDEGRIEISTPFFKRTFAPEEVTAIELENLFPVFAWGVRVRHRKAAYPEKIIFWSLQDPARILEGIRGSDFAPQALPSSEIPYHTATGWPFRRWVWPVVMMIVMLRFFGPEVRPPFGDALVNAGALCIFSSAMLFWPALRRVLLNPEENFATTRFIFKGAAIFSGLVFLGSAVLMAVAAFHH